MKALSKKIILVASISFLFHSAFAQESVNTLTQELNYRFKYNSPNLGQIHILGPPSYSYVSATNTSADSITITEFIFSGDLEFSGSSPLTLPYTLKPNQGTNYMFNFSFVQKDTGIRTANLIVISNSSSSPDTLTITAETVDPGFGPWDWRSMGCPFENCAISSIDIDPEDDNIWYVSSANELYITRDGGESWEKKLSCNLCYPHIVGIDPNNPERIYAGATNNFYGSTDKGLTWTLLRTFPYFWPTLGAVTSAEINSKNGTIYIPYNVGSDNDDKNPGIYISSDYGSTWDFHSFGINEDRIISWDIEHDPITGILYVCTEIGDHPQPYNPPFFRSLDNGITWEEVSNELYWHGLRIQINPDNQVVYCLLEASNLYKSSDNGLSWENQSYCMWVDMLLDSVHDNCLFGSKSTFGGIIKGGVYVSLDEARHDELVGLSNISVGSLRLNGSSSKIFAMAEGIGIFMAPVPLIIDISPILNISLVNSIDKTYLYAIKFQSSEDGMVYILPEYTDKDIVSIREASIDSMFVFADSMMNRSATSLENGNYWAYALDTTGNISEKSEFTVFGMEYDKDAPILYDLIVNEKSNFLEFSCTEDATVYIVPPNTANDLTIIRDSSLDSIFGRAYSRNYIAITGLTAETYWLYAVDGNGNISFARNFVVTSTGILNSGDNRISIYPNPTRDQINIIAKKIEKYIITIYSPLGQLVYKKNMIGDSFQVDLSTYQMGIYIVTIKSKDHLISERIVKF